MSGARISAVAVLAALAFLAACSGATEPLAAAPTDLAGTAWVSRGHDPAADALVFEAVATLEGEVVGYAFGAGGRLVHRSFGRCATPPLTFFDVEGTWRPVPGKRLELSHPGLLPENPAVYEVVQRTATALHLRRVPAADRE